MPKISIQIVTYNSAETVEACLASVFQQVGADYGLVIVDNASTDETVARIEKMGLPVVVNDSNLGYAGAHNQAIDQTDSDYILTLNPDVWLDPHFLCHMGHILDNHAKVGSASGRLLRVDRLGQLPFAVDGTGLFMQRRRRQRLRHEGEPVDQCPAEIRPIFGPDGSVAFYRRAMLEDIRVMGEVFDTDFFVQKEDVDVCWRAQLRGWSSLYVPMAIAHHIRAFRAGQRSRQLVSKEMRFYAVRNRYLLMLKNEIPSHFWRDILPIAAYDLGILAYIAVREWESISALASVLALAGRMRAKRKIIQTSRLVGRKEIQQWFE